MKNLIRAVAMSTLMISGVALAGPLENHPELKAAHESITTARNSLKAANDMKKTEFGGHRAKAEQLLKDAQHEIEMAAEYANNPANK